MKKGFIISISFMLLILSGGFLQKAETITGAWHSINGTTENVFIFQDGYFSHTVFDKQHKKFIATHGGTFNIAGGQLNVNIEFDSESKDRIGTTKQFPISISANKLKLTINGDNKEWSRIDNGTGDLAGNWRISGRMNNGQIQPIQRSARKTLKLLSGTRFQWMAINPETKEFFGTGGGTYTFTNGKYTENIEFFSRDSSRVGASLTFDGSVAGNIWTHSGKNSRGEPLHEEWSREK
jgi:hypothetical protein